MKPSKARIDRELTKMRDEERKARAGYHFEEWACVAVVTLVGNKLGYKFKPVRPDGTLVDKPFNTLKSAKGMSFVRVGGIYHVEVKDDGLSVSVLRYLRWYPNDETVTAWEAESNATTLAYHVGKAHRAQRKGGAEAARNFPLECMTPLRRAYLAATGTERLALEVLVLSYLRDWRGL